MLHFLILVHKIKSLKFKQILYKLLLIKKDFHLQKAEHICNLLIQQRLKIHHIDLLNYLQIYHIIDQEIREVIHIIKVVLLVRDWI